MPNEMDKAEGNEVVFIENFDQQERHEMADSLEGGFFSTQFDTLKVNNIVYYIVEGDLLLTEEEVFDHIKIKNKPSQNNKIVVTRINGKLSTIENPDDIRYAIIKESFSSSEYPKVVQYMHKATTGWAGICNVRFNHVQELDDRLSPNANPDNLTFVVEKLKVQKDNLLASAFYPNYEKERRRIFITPKFFSTKVNKTGILRHEIGHILGFRHEHRRSEAPEYCKKGSEDVENFEPLTDYDPMSVMHAICGRFGSRKLNFTESDSLGASMVYK